MNYFKKGRRTGVPGAGRKPSEKTKAALREKEIAARKQLIDLEQKNFDKFLKAQKGAFNGFEFPELFHQKYDKTNAVYVAQSDDCAEVETPFGKFHTGADDVTCYFLSKNPTKKVMFNRSVYFI